MRIHESFEKTSSPSNGGTIEKAVDLLLTFITTDAHPEKVRSALGHLEQECMHEWVDNTEDPIGDIGCLLTASLAISMDWLIDRKKDIGERHVVRAIKTEPIDAFEGGINVLIVKQEEGAADYRAQSADHSVDSQPYCLSHRVKIEEDEWPEVKEELIVNDFAVGDMTTNKLVSMENKEGRGMDIPAKLPKRSCVAKVSYEKLKDDIEDENSPTGKDSNIEKDSGAWSDDDESEESDEDDEEENYEESKVKGEYENSKVTNGRKKNLMKNSNDEQKSSNFPCEFCNRSFEFLRSLRKHKRIHPENEETGRPHKCDQCGLSFAQSATLNVHKITHLPLDHPLRKRSKCIKCGKMVSSGTLTRHMETHLDDNDPKQADIKRPFKCQQCGKGFRAPQNLKQHMNMHAADENGKRPYGCDICSQRFTRPESLKKHKTLHLPDDDPRKKKYECNICGKTSTTQKNLRTHQQTHLDAEERKKRYEVKCQECGKTFLRSDRLKQHMYTHEGVERKEKLHECDICGKNFDRPWKLENHKNDHLPDDNPLKVKHDCDICGKILMNQKYLRLHKRRHLSSRSKLPTSSKRQNRALKDANESEENDPSDTEINPL